MLLTQYVCLLFVIIIYLEKVILSFVHYISNIRKLHRIDILIFISYRKQFENKLFSSCLVRLANFYAQSS